MSGTEWRTEFIQRQRLPHGIDRAAPVLGGRCFLRWSCWALNTVSVTCAHRAQPLCSTVVATSAVVISVEITRLAAASRAYVNWVFVQSSSALRVCSPLREP